MIPQIYTLKKWNNSISFSPERWGLITQINLNWKDILYFNEETFLNPEKNVRGWIPLMFPNAWPLNENKIYDLKQHWFARNANFEYFLWENFIEMTLNSNSETKKQYNYDFIFKIHAELIDDFIIIKQIITNLWWNKMPISSGFHPYFSIKNQNKNNLKTSFLENNYFDIWHNWWTKSVFNPWIFEVDFIDYNIVFEFDEIFEKIWLWSELEKDFICIEPVLRDENWLIDNPIMINPLQTLEFWMKIKIKN